MVTPQQMRDIIVSRRLRVEPASDDVGNWWIVKSFKGERVTKNSYASPELAVEEAERILSQAEIKSHERLCVEVVTFLSAGEYYIHPRVVTIPHPDNPLRTIDTTVFDGIRRADETILVTGESSHLAAALKVQEITATTPTTPVIPATPTTTPAGLKKG